MALKEIDAEYYLMGGNYLEYVMAEMSPLDERNGIKTLSFKFVKDTKQRDADLNSRSLERRVAHRIVDRFTSQITHVPDVYRTFRLNDYGLYVDDSSGILSPIRPVRSDRGEVLVFQRRLGGENLFVDMQKLNRNSGGPAEHPPGKDLFYLYQYHAGAKGIYK